MARCGVQHQERHGECGPGARRTAARGTYARFHLLTAIRLIIGSRLSRMSIGLVRCVMDRVGHCVLRFGTGGNRHPFRCTGQSGSHRRSALDQQDQNHQEGCGKRSFHVEWPAYLSIHLVRLT